MMALKRPLRLALLPQNQQRQQQPPQGAQLQPAKQRPAAATIAKDNDKRVPEASTIISNPVGKSNDQEQHQVKSLGERFLVMISTLKRISQLPAVTTTMPFAPAPSDQEADPPVSPLLAKLRNALPQTVSPRTPTATISSPSKAKPNSLHHVDISPYLPLPFEQRETQLVSPIKRRRRKRLRRRRRKTRPRIQWLTSHATWSERAAELHRQTRAPYDPRSPHIKALVDEIGQLDQSFYQQQNDSKRNVVLTCQFIRADGSKRVQERNQVEEEDEQVDLDEGSEDEKDGGDEGDKDEEEEPEDCNDQNDQTGNATEQTEAESLTQNESPETRVDTTSVNSLALQLSTEDHTPETSMGPTEPEHCDPHTAMEERTGQENDQPRHASHSFFPMTSSTLGSIVTEQHHEQLPPVDSNNANSSSPSKALGDRIKYTDEKTPDPRPQQERRPIHHHHAVWISDELRNWLIETGMFQTRDKSQITLSRTQQLHVQRV